MESTITPPQVISADEIATAVIHLVIPREDMAKHMDPAIQEVIQTVTGQGASLVGPAVAYHHRRPTETFDFELGFPVSDPIKPAGRVVNSALPGVRIARAVYQGPYEGLPGAWGELDAWVRASEYTGAGGFWESYVTNPAEVKDPAEWRTELSMVVE